MGKVHVYTFSIIHVVMHEHVYMYTIISGMDSNPSMPNIFEISCGGASLLTQMYILCVGRERGSNL